MVDWGEGQDHYAEIRQPRAHPETEVRDYLKSKWPPYTLILFSLKMALWSLHLEL